MAECYRRFTVTMQQLLKNEGYTHVQIHGLIRLEFLNKGTEVAMLLSPLRPGDFADPKKWVEPLDGAEVKELLVNNLDLPVYVARDKEETG